MVNCVEPVGKGLLVAIVVADAFPFSSLAASSEVISKGLGPIGSVTIEERERPEYLVSLLHQVISTRESQIATAGSTQGWAYTTLEYEIVR